LLVASTSYVVLKFEAAHQQVQDSNPASRQPFLPKPTCKNKTKQDQTRLKYSQVCCYYCVVLLAVIIIIIIGNNNNGERREREREAEAKLLVC